MIAVLLGADALLWRWGVQQVQADFADWSAGMRADGYTITAGPAHTAGYPLAAELRVSGLAISGPLGDLPVNGTWSAATVLAAVMY